MTEKKTTETETKTEPTVTIDGRKVTWGYSKKVNLGNYESAEVSIYMTDVVPEEYLITDYLGKETEARFDMLKAEVWGAHDLEYGFTEEGRPELVVQVPAPVAAPVPAASAPAAAPAAPAPNAAVAGSLVGVYPDTPVFCKDCAGVEFWDNRAQNDKKIGESKKIGPDFKCKNCDGGSGNTKPIYRPGSYDYNQSVGKTPVAPAAMQPPAAPTATTNPQAPLTSADSASDESPF